MNHQPWQERGKDMSQLSEEQLDQIIAAERAREQEPLNELRTIAARAREEGLIRESQSLGLRGSSQPWLQAAAAILLLLGGIAIGHTTVGLPSTAQPDGSNVVATPPAVTPAATQQTGASTGT